MSNLSINFHGHNLSVLAQNNEPYTPMKAIVEGMGLSWQGQHEKLINNNLR